MMLNPTCSFIVPGWPKLEQYARTTWGEGDWTIAINPPGYKDKPATMCVAEAVQVVMTGAPKCSEIRKDIPPEKKNSNQIKVDEGYTNTGNWNITHVTTAAHAEFFSANFELPNIALLHFDSLETIGQFINAPRNSFSTVASNVTIRTTELTPVPDRTCIGTVNFPCSTPTLFDLGMFSPFKRSWNRSVSHLPEVEFSSLPAGTFGSTIKPRGHLWRILQEPNMRNTPLRLKMSSRMQRIALHGSNSMAL
jgi:hypothetical protein